MQDCVMTTKQNKSRAVRPCCRSADSAQGCLTACKLLTNQINVARAGVHLYFVGNATDDRFLAEPLCHLYRNHHCCITIAIQAVQEWCNSGESQLAGDR